MSDNIMKIRYEKWTGIQMIAIYNSLNMTEQEAKEAIEILENLGIGDDGIIVMTVKQFENVFAVNNNEVEIAK